MYIVYYHKNKINGHGYVGITCQSAKSRWRDGAGYKVGAFHKAIEKYGWDNFEHTILVKNVPTVDIANEYEKYYIKELNTFYKNGHGYNLTLGGEGTDGWEHTEEAKQKMRDAKIGKFDGENNPMYGVPSPNKGKHLSDETKEKIRAKKLGIKRTDAQKKKISETLKNRYAVFGSRSHTEEEKAKISSANKGQKLTDEQYKRLLDAKAKSRGYILVCNGEVAKQIRPEELDTYLQNGYIKGNMKTWNKRRGQ